MADGGSGQRPRPHAVDIFVVDESHGKEGAREVKSAPYTHPASCYLGVRKHA